MIEPLKELRFEFDVFVHAGWKFFACVTLTITDPHKSSFQTNVLDDPSFPDLILNTLRLNHKAVRRKTIATIANIVVEYPSMSELFMTAHLVRPMTVVKPVHDAAVIEKITQTSIGLLSCLQSAPHAYEIVKPAFVTSFLVLYVSGIDSLKETLVSILASLMRISSDDVHFLLHICDPAPPYASDKIPYGCAETFPTVGKTLAQSLEELVDSESHFSIYSVRDFIVPFSSLYLMSTILNFVSTLPNDSPLRYSLVLFLRHFGTHHTILTHFELITDDSKRSLFLSLNFRRLLINLTQFLSDEDTSSVIQGIQSYHGGFNRDYSDFLQNYVHEEVKTLLPDSLRPSPLRIKAVRPFLRTLTKTVSYHFHRGHTDMWFVYEPRYLNEAFNDLIVDFAEQEKPSTISKIRLNCFPNTMLLSWRYEPKLLSFMLRCESPKDLEFCFSMLSKHSRRFGFSTIRLGEFQSLIEIGTHLIRSRESSKVPKTILRSLMHCVYWDCFDMSTLLPTLLPLVAEILELFKKRGKGTVLSSFLEHVALVGISQLEKDTLDEDRIRFATSTYLRLSFAIPTLRGLQCIMDRFAFCLAGRDSQRPNARRVLISRILVEEGCEDLFASTSLKTKSPLHFTAVMNH
ncbi:hypothetical protein BLNAU_3921 [Blattamonas nauphoetae]|uniref:Uncharacterized protein n=1 Tax=Blattamonas nauphoetae TaxID=2049346 RepID=A0ABQ9YBL2_9EUKA|nr:hypothetical protein BLNAU_3921 [Blattamonas nauphoetae]